jgi:hypothetical protein
MLTQTSPWIYSDKTKRSHYLSIISSNSISILFCHPHTHLRFRFSDGASISHGSHACYMPCPRSPFHHSNSVRNTLWSSSICTYLYRRVTSLLLNVTLRILSQLNFLQVLSLSGAGLCFRNWSAITLMHSCSLTADYDYSHAYSGTCCHVWRENGDDYVLRDSWLSWL